MSQDTEPRNNLIVLYGILSTLAVTFLTVALILLFMHTANKSILEKVERAPTETLQALHTREDGLLLNAAYDPQEKIARMPIATAMELEAQQPWHPQATPLPAPPAAAAGATTDTTATTATQPAAAPADAATTQTQTPAAAAPAAQMEPVNAASH